jgi:hypothetical protein
MKKTFILLALAATFSSCKVGNVLAKNTSVEYNAPQNFLSPAEVIFKIWNGEEMIKQLVPPTSGLGKFVDQSSKYCTIYITKFPQSGNDTLAVAVKCKTDEITKQIAGKFGK